jgi:glycosyltransferase involved in cell wall biosynthesis
MVESGRRSVSDLLTLRRLALNVHSPDDAARALRLLAQTPPRDDKELQDTVDALAEGTVTLARTYEDTLIRDPRTEALNRDSLIELIDEFELVAAYRKDRSQYDVERMRVLRESTRPLRVVTQALVRCRAWAELAEFIAITPGSQLLGPRGALAGFPTAEVASAATLALTAGNATAASILAARALAAKPKDAGLQATFDNARDQLSIARRGWQFPSPIAFAAHERDPRAVLSVLSQSRPVTSGGYATRSHGILTGLAARGRNMRAVTRLGFPYDRWRPADPRTVSVTDEIDGITYHRLLRDGIRVYPQFPLAGYIAEFTDGLIDIATAHRASLIHASSFYVTGLAGLTAARRLGLPFAYEMRGLEELMKVSRDPAFEGSDRHRFLDHLETGVAKHADAVFVITAALGREMARRGVAEDRLVVVPNGVHTDSFQPQERDRELEVELGVAGKTVIGYVGGLVDYEGLDVLLDAVAGLKNTHDNLHVLVVGDGAYERTIRTKAARLRLGDVVTFTGRVPHDQVVRYLSLVDIAPFPRLPLPVCELISPIKPFESMAMGKAIVVSDVAALHEFVEDGVTGRVFRKGDPDDLRRILEQLLDSPDQRHALGEGAREWVVRERDWSSITAIVDATYTELIERHAISS